MNCRSQGDDRGFVLVATDDATRLADGEVLPDKRRASTTAFLLPALRCFHGQGIAVERGMTDNGSDHRSRRFPKALRWLDIRHICTRP